MQLKLDGGKRADGVISLGSFGVVVNSKPHNDWIAEASNPSEDPQPLVTPRDGHDIYCVPIESLKLDCSLCMHWRQHTDKQSIAIRIITAM
jgi:hypothetical protein